MFCQATQGLKFRDSMANSMPLFMRGVGVVGGEPVRWSAGFNAKFAIYLPPGKNTFGTSVMVSEGRGVFISYRVDIPYVHTVSMEFLPGHSYRISRQKLLLFKINGVIIKDVTPKS